MARIDLKRSSGLPLFYSGEELQPQGLTLSGTTTVCIDDIRSQLLNEDLNCPEIFYKKYKDLDKDEVFKSKNLKINIYLIFPNLAGIEYTKTFATKCLKRPRILEVIYGGGTVLLQKYDSPIKNRIIKSQIKKGQKIIVPQGYTCSIVNSRQTSNLIVLELISRDASPRIVLDDRGGMAYYIIRKNAKQEIVRNPEYKIVNDPEKVDWDTVISKYGITAKTPIVKQVMRKYEKFEWIFKDNSVDI
ncbi:MAG: glucose-6-phosphate isomerase family protein [Candidatus Dojkabacteria bacterium]|jgi:oxalate decarboxylase/phosphoglucose isomerase-like protein (cupin superfamily)|nr:glucose-6-phosphate isomerase family protein [Candidatus Dojkabacteria bacterium]